MRLLLKNGRVVDPANGRDGEFDILIVDGAIARVGRNLPVEGAEVFEVARGWVVTPGLIDIHVHLREPGQETMQQLRQTWRMRFRDEANALHPSHPFVNDHPLKEEAYPSPRVEEGTIRRLTTAHQSE